MRHRSAEALKSDPAARAARIAEFICRHKMTRYKLDSCKRHPANIDSNTEVDSLILRNIRFTSEKPCHFEIVNYY